MSSDRGALRAPISNIVPQPDKKTNCTKVLSGGPGGQTPATRSRNPASDLQATATTIVKGSKILFERGPVNNGSDPGIGEVMGDSSKTTRESQRRPDPNENLVKIFDTEQESEAMVVNGLLESAGIDCDMTALSAPQDTFPGVGGTIILVREEDAARANQVIAEFQQSPGAGDEEFSGETVEGGIREPPTKA
jgi:Putative prokaryotic signal transducing protein